MDRIRVMIAEDEPPIGRFLRSLTEQHPDFQVVGMCESAEEAVREVERLTPQLLITDIRMAGMTGLELIRRIRHTNQDMRVIIISGYKMFEYAREAISLGIEDYITKPVKQEEFYKALEGVRHFYSQEDRLERQAKLEKALKNKDAEAWLKYLPGSGIEVLMIYRSGGLEEWVTRDTRGREDILALTYQNAILYIRCLEDTSGSGGRDLQKILDLQRGGTIAGIRLKRMDTGADNLQQIRELYRWVRRLAVPGQRTAAVYDSLDQITVTQSCPGEELVKRIKIDIEGDNRKQLQADLLQLFTLWEQEKTSVYRMKTVLHEIGEELGRSRMLKVDGILLKEYIDDSIYYSDSYREIYENIMGFLEEHALFAHSAGEGAGKEAGRLFETIAGLIERKPEINYSLQEISLRFGASQPYIRKIFKGFTGVTYNEYVLRRKLELAKELMEVNPDILIKDVADAIGFDQLYFSTVFSKSTGMSPSQYRARLVKGESLAADRGGEDQVDGEDGAERIKRTERIKGGKDKIDGEDQGGDYGN